MTTAIDNDVVHSQSIWWPIVLVLMGGCPTTQAEDGGDDGPPHQVGACEDSSDCIPAGSSCCECPTFALPTTSGWTESCEDVTCDQPASCPLTEAVCDNGSGSCVLRCIEIQCDIICENGFVADEFGCLVCPARVEDCQDLSNPVPRCEEDSDCVQVPADCCGCARGGVDTAVPVAEMEDFIGGQDCGDTQICPEVDVCDPTLIPRCIAGSCQLSPTPAPDVGADAGCDWADGGCEGGYGPAQYCGTPDYPPCPAGQVCILNDPEANEANQSGVGVCQPA